jgi:NAD(P)-dependent dehydrogenase (short-subunit alcohol dehydrogenase family)
MKTWFITGAARGFGALVVERALAKGDAVVATARNPQVVIDILLNKCRLRPDGGGRGSKRGRGRSDLSHQRFRPADRHLAEMVASL